MTDTTLERRALGRRAVTLEWGTIGYNVVEGIVAIAFGIVAGSIALTGFGIDSIIEVTAAGVVLQRLVVELRGAQPDEAKERQALRIVAFTFFALGVYVIVEGLRDLVVGATPSTSPAGIVVTAASLVVMPTLARFKQRVGVALGNRLVIADAAETRLCALLSASTLLGLVGYAVFGWRWLDPLAGFVIAYFAIREGREAWEGELVCDD